MNEQRLTAKITGTGKALPDRRLTNADLERMVDTSDEWITQRVGIRERRIAAPGECTSDFAARAAAAALEQAGLRAEELDLILAATSTPDTVFPPVASLVQRRIGARRAAAADISAACSGFIYGAAMARGMIASGAMRHVMVVGAEVNSRIVNWKDRDTCILFGDGAGAAVFSACPASEGGILALTIGGDGAQADLLTLVNSGCRAFPEHSGRYITMQGNELFRQAVRKMSERALFVLDEAGLRPEDVSLLIPHQANIRIMDQVARRLGLPPGKVFVNIGKYGNTIAGTIPIALCEALEEGRVRKGDVVLTTALGAGLTWGAFVMRWA